MKKWTQATKGMRFLWIPIPASSAVPFFVSLLHISFFTISIAFFVAGFQIYMRRKGRTFFWVVRKIKSRLAFNMIQARTVWYRRRIQRRDSIDLIKIGEVENF